MENTNKYQNGKIYKIVDINYEKCYFGSTIQPLSKRMDGHRRAYQKYKAGLSDYVSSYSMFDEYGVSNCKIELVETYPCNSKEELSKQEGLYIKEHVCVNKKVEGRTPSEYYLAYKGGIDQQHRDYYHNNKDKVKLHRDSKRELLRERGKQTYERHKQKKLDRQKQYNDQHKEQIQQYRAQNKEKLKELNKEWYQKNKAELNQRMSCPICNSCVIKRTFKSHEQTIKHIIALKAKTAHQGTIPH